MIALSDIRKYDVASQTYHNKKELLLLEVTRINIELIAKIAADYRFTVLLNDRFNNDYMTLKINYDNGEPEENLMRLTELMRSYPFVTVAYQWYNVETRDKADHVPQLQIAINHNL